MRDNSPEVTAPETVRLASERDEDALFDVLMALNADNSFGVPASPARVREAIQLGTRHKGGIIGVIDGQDGKLAGTIGLQLQRAWYTDQWHLAEVWLFVRPEYRGRGYDHDLFRYAAWWRAEFSKGGDHPWVLVTSVSSPKRLAAKERLWARHADKVGAIFVMTGA